MTDWKPTHDELVARAVKWLRQPSRGKSGCGVAVPELVSYATEQPDAIGWVGGGYSYVIECKVTRADFLADKRKMWHDFGMGCVRYYMCPPGLIKSEEIPPYYGLLYCYQKQVRLIKEPGLNTNRNSHGELAMMYSLLRRVEKRGNLTECFSRKWGGDK